MNENEIAVKSKEENFLSTIPEWEAIRSKGIMIPYSEAKPIEDDKEVDSSKKMVTANKASVKAFKESVSPIKSFLDKAHKLVAEFEKTEVSKVDAINKAIDSEIQKYLEAKAKKQTEIKALFQGATNSISSKRRELAQFEQDVRSWCVLTLAKIEKEEAQRLAVPAADKVDLIEEKQSLINDLKKEADKVVVPEVVKEAPKVFLKKDEVKVKTIPTIVDEIAFIGYALSSGNMEVLDIKISKSAAKKFLDGHKDPGSLPGIEVKEEYK